MEAELDSLKMTERGLLAHNTPMNGKIHPENLLEREVCAERNPARTEPVHPLRPCLVAHQSASPLNYCYYKSDR